MQRKPISQRENNSGARRNTRHLIALNSFANHHHLFSFVLKIYYRNERNKPTIPRINPDIKNAYLIIGDSLKNSTPITRKSIDSGIRL